MRRDKRTPGDSAGQCAYIVVSDVELLHHFDGIISAIEYCGEKYKSWRVSWTDRERSCNNGRAKGSEYVVGSCREEKKKGERKHGEEGKKEEAMMTGPLVAETRVRVRVRVECQSQCRSAPGSVSCWIANWDRVPPCSTGPSRRLAHCQRKFQWGLPAHQGQKAHRTRRRRRSPGLHVPCDRMARCCACLRVFRPHSCLSLSYRAVVSPLSISWILAILVFATYLTILSSLIFPGFCSGFIKI